MRRSRILGGMHGLGRPRSHPGPAPRFLRGDPLALVNGRSALRLIVKTLKPRTAWIPSYVCGEVVRAAVFGPTKAAFYEVDGSLAVPSGEWIEGVRRGDVVVFVDYFGFPHDRSLAARARRKGAWIVEDAAQALLSPAPGSGADYVLYSPRKFVGVPDGGILATRGSAPEISGPFRRPPRAWSKLALDACLGRRRFDEGRPSTGWFERFTRAEREAPLGPYAASRLATRLLRTGFDYRAIARRRRANYRILLEELGDLALFRRLPPSVVPLGFPVRCPRRDGVRKRLFARRIYPPVHWPLRGVVPARFAASHRLSREIMTLPCDQRFDAAEMRRMAAALREDLARAGR